MRGEGMRRKPIVKENVLMLCRVGLLCAVALVLSVLENMVPALSVSLPGMKLGLSNLAVMFALELCPLPCALSIVAVKALFALATRGVAAFMMSFAGSVCATLGMYLLIRSKRVSFGCLGVGIGGAFLHNMGQFAVALVIVSDAAVMYLPVLCVASLATGSLTALVYYTLMPPLKKIPLMSRS